MRLRLGSGSNVGYVTAVENNAVNGADWLSDREAGLRATVPLLLQLLVTGLYGTVGLLAMTAEDSVKTAAVSTIWALVYEVGRPTLPKREEAVRNDQLNVAVDTFAAERILVCGRVRTCAAPVAA